MGFRPNYGLNIPCCVWGERGNSVCKRFHPLCTNFRPHPDAQEPRRTPVPHRDLHRSSRPNKRQQRAALHVPERATQRAHVGARHPNPHPRLDIGTWNVRDERSEAVDVKDLTHYSRPVMMGRGEWGVGRVGDGRAQLL